MAGTLEDREWVVQYLEGDPNKPKTIKVAAAYYHVDDQGWAVEFKDANNKVVFAAPKERVTSIGHPEVELKPNPPVTHVHTYVNTTTNPSMTQWRSANPANPVKPSGL